MVKLSVLQEDEVEEEETEEYAVERMRTEISENYENEVGLVTSAVVCTSASPCYHRILLTVVPSVRALTLLVGRQEGQKRQKRKPNYTFTATTTVDVRVVLPDLGGPTIATRMGTTGFGER